MTAVASSTFGSSLKMPPGDLPVTMAHVANVTRSAASRDVVFFASVIGFALFTTGVVIRGHRAG